MLEKITNLIRARRQSETAIYEVVAKELQTGAVANGLWTKAYANSSGDKSKAEALYIKYRVQSIKDELSQNKPPSNDEEMRTEDKTSNVWLRKSEYKSKYWISDSLLNNAIYDGRLKSWSSGGKVWVEDRDL